MLFSSCQAQVNTHSPSDSSKVLNVFASKHPKMIRTQGVQSGNVFCELQDKDGNLWFSTGGEGVYRFDGESFTNFTTKDGLCNNDVKGIIQDKEGNILIGTESGICKYDGKTFSKFFQKDFKSDHMISCLFLDRDDNIWFGTLNNGVYRYDGKTLTNFLNKNDHTFNLGNHYQLILDIIQDRKGDLWFSSWNGGAVWRYDGKSFTNYLPSKNYYLSNEDGRNINKSESDALISFLSSGSSNQDSITDDMIFSMTEDKEGNLWFATRRHGACRYDGKTFYSFRENEDFVSYGVYAILEDKKGNMWFTTDKNGVYCYDGKAFKNYTTKDGLVNNSVFSILEDKEGNMWFGTRGFGLSRFDGTSFTTFSE